MFPKIVDQNGNKLVTMNFTIPENIDPSKVTVSIKDRDLIFKAEDRVDKPDAFSRFYYYKKATLPETTDFDNLKCNYEKGRICVQAQLRTNYKTMNLRNIPIDSRVIHIEVRLSTIPTASVSTTNWSKWSKMLSFFFF